MWTAGGGHGGRVGDRTISHCPEHRTLGRARGSEGLFKEKPAVMGPSEELKPRGTLCLEAPSTTLMILDVAVSLSREASGGFFWDLEGLRT